MSHELGGRSNFDIVIVGGGSGGGVVASRLSEDLSREVALVEAGPDYTSIDSLPEDIRDGSDVTKASRLGDHFWTYTARVNHHISKNLSKNKLSFLFIFTRLVVSLIFITAFSAN
mgnify:CR=1 FL=1